MKFECDGISFADAINKVSRALPLTKNQDFILNGVKLEAKDNLLHFYATDGELIIKTSIKAVIYLDGKILLQGRFLKDFFKNVNEKIVCESTDNKKLNIMYGDSDIKLACLDIDQYPNIAEITEEKKFKIKGEKLKNLIKKTIISVGVNNNNEVLKGIFFKTEDNKISATGLDGYRLSVCQEEIDTKEEIEAIIPLKSADEILKTIEENDEIIEVGVNDKRIKFKFKNTTIYSTLIQGKYIDIKNIIPKSFETEIIIEKKMLEEVLDRVSFVKQSDGSSILKIEIKEKIIKIETSSEIVNNLSEKLPITLKGKDILIGVNGEYIRNCLKVMDDIFIKMKFINSTSPCVIEPAEKEGYIYMYLPIKIGY